MDESIERALDAWRELYGGELVDLPGSAPGLEAIAVRRNEFRRNPGNWPKIFHHRRSTPRVLVLIHGLKDSPGYLEEIARRFAARGVNVLLPLMPAHGRRDPISEMRRADYRAWRSRVDRAVEIAALFGAELSIGGLSTGGALAIDKCLRDPPMVGGKVFLFAAALGLSRTARLVLSSRLATRLCDAGVDLKANDGIGGNPLKYSRDYFAASRQVHLLIEAVRRRAGDDFARPRARQGGANAVLHGRVFVAHSEADRTIPVEAVTPLVEPGDPGQHHLIPEAVGVAHADLVMAEAMTFEKRWPDEPDPPRANPEFEPMIDKALAFLEC